MSDAKINLNFNYHKPYGIRLTLLSNNFVPENNNQVRHRRDALHLMDILIKKLKGKMTTVNAYLKTCHYDPIISRYNYFKSE